MTGNGTIYISVFFAVLVLCMQSACALPQDRPVPMTHLSDSDSSYVFDRPDVVFELPGDLDEISGLTVLDDRYLGAVQDEDGRLYIINMETGEIEDDPKFENKGDYEGVERVEDRVFVLRSDGTLYEIENWRAEKLETQRHRTKLKSKHDTEGLAYDAANERLLIACKEYAGKGLDLYKAIYAFDLREGVLIDDPVYLVKIQSFNDEAETDNAVNERLRNILSPVIDLSGFKPSALAIHPITDQIYVLSSVRKAIVVLQQDGDVDSVWSLPESLFEQPEGLTFLSNGDLFISNEEGGRRHATLLRYNYQNR